MGDHFGYSLSNINRIVHLLNDQGLIAVSPGSARSIQLVEDDRDKLIVALYEALQKAQEWNWMEDGVPRDVTAEIVTGKPQSTPDHSTDAQYG